MFSNVSSLIHLFQGFEISNTLYRLTSSTFRYGSSFDIIMLRPHRTVFLVTVSECHSPLPAWFADVHELYLEEAMVARKSCTGGILDFKLKR